MVEIIQSTEFKKWLRKLRDDRVVARISVRIRRLAGGNPGDVQPVGEGVSELRINYGPGYRVYYKRKGAILIVLLCGGDKSTQDEDIKKAKRIANETDV